VPPTATQASGPRGLVCRTVRAGDEMGLTLPRLGLFWELNKIGTVRGTVSEAKLVTGFQI
jgi:hypothetical protein